MFEVKIDEEKCNGCGSCADICPMSVFVIENEKSTPENMEDCEGCESCVESCEQAAITVTES